MTHFNCKYFLHFILLSTDIGQLDFYKREIELLKKQTEVFKKKTNYLKIEKLSKKNIVFFSIKIH